MSDDFECPYCNEIFEYSDDPLDQDEAIEWECSKCGKNFMVQASYSVDYYVEKAECLNDGDHKYKEVTRYPRVINGNVLFRCYRGCGKERSFPESQENIK